MPRSCAALLALLLTSSALGVELRVLQPVFDPTAGQVLYVLASDPVDGMALQVLTPDGHVVRALGARSLGDDDKLRDAVAASGGGLPGDPWRTVFVWDGKDADGRVLPDEAYVPRVVAADGTALLDPRDHSGGETITPTDVRLTTDGVVLYTLPERARVMVRIGVRGGPLLRTPVQWAVRPAGANRQNWDGFDTSGVDRVLGHPELASLVVAHALPEHSLVTFGNAAHTYQQYLQTAGLAQPEAPEAIVFERAGQRLTHAYWLPRWQTREPVVELSVVTPDVERNGDTITLDRPVTLQVSMSEQDRYVMGLSQYEIAFFIDHAFFAEEETGYVPLQWQLRPADVDPGIHTLTVNVAGLWGHVGVASLKIQVE